jgi:hypothetical protein
VCVRGRLPTGPGERRGANRQCQPRICLGVSRSETGSEVTSETWERLEMG